MQFSGSEMRQTIRSIEEPVGCIHGDESVSKRTKLAPIIVAAEGPGAEGMRVGDSEFVDDA